MDTASHSSVSHLIICFFSASRNGFFSAHSLNIGLSQLQCYHIYILSLGLNIHPLKWLLNPNPLSLPLLSSGIQIHTSTNLPLNSSSSTLQHPSHSSSKSNCIQFSWTYFFIKLPIIFGDSPQTFKSLPSMLQGSFSFSLYFSLLCIFTHILHNLMYLSICYVLLKLTIYMSLHLLECKQMHNAKKGKVITLFTSSKIIRFSPELQSL